MPARVTIEAIDRPLQVARANMAVSPPQRIGEIIDMAPGTTLAIIVNAYQGVLVKEAP